MNPSSIANKSNVPSPPGQPRRWTAAVLVALPLLVTTPVRSQDGDAASGDARRHVRIDLSEINLGFEDADADLVRRLARQLSDQDYRVREQAAHQLSELGPSAFRGLSVVFAATHDYETSIRIQEIVREQFLWHTLFSRKGFLGIQFDPSGLVVRDDRLPGPVLAVPVTAVVAGLPAEKAGLQAGDLIVAVDGDYLTNDADRPDFPELITTLGAGATIHFTVLRNRQQVELTAVLIARPIRNYRDNPRLSEELRGKIQAFSLWWSQHFVKKKVHHDRTPSTVIFSAPP